VTQAAEHLPSGHKAQVQTPVLPKKEGRKQGRREGGREQYHKEYVLLHDSFMQNYRNCQRNTVVAKLLLSNEKENEGWVTRGHEENFGGDA
jgi:hypothetical protein